MGKREKGQRREENDIIIRGYDFKEKKLEC